ncbi:unnamed protein product [Cladocopium goreaui]|uniref:Uncharacterized protein n=1 Tax=Cladocopium goreaui TaxID=2562237 RepID=A0A9P1BM68_9DINO|nr:unnamed protein product [Cladocopium goreaui]
MAPLFSVPLLQKSFAGNGFHGARRWYTPRSRRNWSLQHHRIRIPRPMVDRFDLSRVQPQKEWWRERRIAPATFFGFPDVTKAGLRGGSVYVEQMDAVTLAVLTDKCVQEDVWDPEIWMKFAWRAQQLCARTHEPDLCYIFRAFARADWFDQNLLTTYLGRLHRRLPMFQLPDVAVLLEAFANPRFRQGEYLHRSLTHMGLLLQHRDDASVEDLAKTCIALRDLYPQPEEISTEVKAGLQLLGEALLLRELSELTPSQAVHVLHCMTHWRLVNTEQQTSNAPADLSWTLARELKGKLRNAGKEKPEDLAVLAEAMFTGGIRHEELWEELVTNLEFEMHRLPASFAASAAYAASRFGHRGAKLYSNAGRRLGEEAPKMSPMDCAYAAGAFLRGPASVAEKVLRGAIGERILELGFGSFDPEALTLMLNSLSRAEPGVWGVETMASSLLQEIHSRLHELDADQLTSIVRSLGHLQPEVPEVLKQVLDHCQLKVEDAGGISPRSLARLCQGIAMQPSTTLPDASERLVSLIPQVRRALEAKPTAVSTAQIFWSYSRCSFDERDAVLKDADTRLTERAIDLTADLLLNLVEAMEAIGRTGWSPSEALVQKVSYLLDMKRYDLQPGRLWRATKAFESLGVAPKLIPPLETRDQPAAAQTKRPSLAAKVEKE